MGISVHWQEHGEGAITVLVYTVESPWSVEDMVNALNRASELGSQHQRAPEYIVFDVTRSESLPAGFLSALRHLEATYREDVKLRVLVGANRILQTVFSVIGRVTPTLTRRMHIAETMPEAFTLIRDHARRNYVSRSTGTTGSDA